MTRTTLAGCAGAALLLAGLLPARPAHADYHVESPTEIDLGELEIEHNGALAVDPRSDVGRAASYTLEFGTGLTSWWHSEIEFGFERNPGGDQPTALDALVWENGFELTEPGEYWADLGIYAEYGQNIARGRYAGANEITFGPMIAKDIGQTTHTLNLFLERQFGPDKTSNGLDLSYAWQSRWNIWAPLSPAVEVYGDMGVLGSTGRFNQQQFLAGPVGVGALRFKQLGLGNAGQLKYEIGWLFGATTASPRGALRWRLEAEVPF